MASAPPGTPRRHRLRLRGLGTPRRHRLRLRGLVQGVGFRPHLYALALRHGLSGFVFNDKEGLLAEAQGEAEALKAFEAALQATLPPLARLDSMEIEEVPPLRGQHNLHEAGEGFAILQSPKGEARPLMSVGPDMAPCKACLEELFSPTRRRFLYAFLNCTHCGPRFSISLRLPWDRPNTTLAAFHLCKACSAEYENPADRRFHAQPIACPACGPALEGKSGTQRTPNPLKEEGLQRFVACIAEGGILALKAAGGFQLACDAHNEAAIKRLRMRKMRDGKPLALMVPNLATARRYAELSTLEEALLQSPQRPIVLAKRAASNTGLADAIAPGLAHWGLCLPSTPLHYVLFYEALGRPSCTDWLEKPHRLAWIMTSANFSGEPLAVDNAEALSKLSGVADTFALHNRPIAVRMDDSVLQVAAGVPQLLRRARGFVPTPLPLPWPGPPLLAVGGHQKSTFCLLHDNRAYVSQHLGDLDSPEARTAFGDSISRLCALLKLKPALLAADMHPDYFSTQWAQATGLPCLPVQHHAAHVAAVWAEYPELPGPLLGLALDGAGLGTDGLPWGGELLWAEAARADGGDNNGPNLLLPQGWQRLGHLKPLPLWGGDAAAKQPWRLGAAALLALGQEANALAAGAPHGLSPALLEAWKRGGLKAPLSTSLGRFFDAAANLLGLCETADFEAEAPMRLEALAHRACNRHLPLPWPLEGFEVEADNVLNLLGLLRRLEGCRLPAAGKRLAEGAALWLHEAVAKALAQWAAGEARRRGVVHVALAGGCLQNRLLCEALVRQLRRRGLSPLLPRQLPPNDGGLCLGQAWVAIGHFAPRLKNES